MTRAALQRETERLQQFWDARYTGFGLAESGWLGAGERANAYLYRCKAEALRRALRRLGYHRGSAFDVLDAGCGQGFFAAFYERCYPRARYVGLDLCESVVAHLQAAHPALEFHAGNLITWEAPRRRRFDVVQCFEVLHLIADDDLVGQALRTFARHAPGGHVLLTAVLSPRTLQPADYLRYRARELYEGLFASARLVTREERRIYFWMPDGGPRWPLLQKVLHRAGPAMLYWTDRLALRLGLPAALGGACDSRMKLVTLEVGEAS